MTAYNIVRMRVKPELLDAFLTHYRERAMDMPGMKSMTVIQTGERDFNPDCFTTHTDSIRIPYAFHTEQIRVNL